MNLSFSANSFFLLVASIAILLCYVSTGISAAYVLINGARPVCFAEEMSSEHEVVIFQYTRKAMQATSEHEVRLQAYSPVTKTMFQDRVLKKNAQIITFPVRITSQVAELGEYEICLSLNDERSFFASGTKEGGILMEILIDHRDRRKPLSSATESQAAALRTKVKGGDEVFTFTDEDGTVKESLRTHDYLDRVTNHLNRIDRVIDEVVDEARYFTARQSRMRITSETSFTRIWGFSVLVICMVVAVSLLQFLSLRSFLLGKKLI